MMRTASGMIPLPKLSGTRTARSYPRLGEYPTFSRLEHQVTCTDSTGLPRRSSTTSLPAIPSPPPRLSWDLDHTEDPTYGQQEFTFYNHHYQSGFAICRC